MDPTAATPWRTQASRFLSPHKSKIVVSLLASGLSMGALAAIPVLQRSVIDDDIRGNGAVGVALIAMVGVGVLRFAASLIRRFVGGRVSFDVQLDARNAIYEHLLALDMSVHDGLQTGQLVSRANSDLGLIQQLLAWGPMVLGSLLQAVISLVVMAVLNLPLFGVALIVPLATFRSARSLRHSVFPSSWDAQSHEADVTSFVEESVSGVRVVKAFAREDMEVRRFSDAASKLYASRLRNIRLRARMTAELQSIPSFGQLGVLAFGGWLAIHGSISIGTFVAFATYMTQLAAPARMLAGILTVGQQARAGVERISEILDLQPGMVERPDAYDLPPISGAVELDSVTVSYADGRAVLDEVSLHLKPGEAVAVIGPSGSGKSSLCNLLGRMYDPSVGSVRVDGIDIAEVTLRSLRSQVGMVFEDSFLFGSSIEDNVRFGRPDATHSEVAAACRLAQADIFVDALPDGYATVVGEGGITLSGGQRQRLALARTLLGHPRLLVLDNATSAVDPHTESLIISAIRNLEPQPTIVVTSQRPSVLGLVDRVALLDDGRLTDDGTPADVALRSAWMRTFMDVGGDGAHELGPARRDDYPFVVEASQPSVGPLPTAGAGRVGGGGRATSGGGQGWVAMLGQPPPAIRERIAALPPANDVPSVDIAAQAEATGPLKLRRFLRPWRKALALGGGLVALDALSGIASPLLIRTGIDSGVQAHSSMALAAVSATFFLLILVSWWDQWAETVQTGRTGESILLGLRIRVFAQLQRLGIDFYEKEMTGRIVTRATNDVAALSQLLQNGLVNALVSLASFAGITVIVFVMNVKLAVVALAVLPVLIAATVVYRSRSASAYDRQRDAVAAVNTHLQESISGVRVVQALGREQTGLSTFASIGVVYREASLSALGVQATYVALSDLLSAISTVLVLWVGSGLVVSHRLAIGALVAFVLYVTQLFSPVQQLAQTFDSYQRALAGARKINSVLAEEPSVISPPNTTRAVTPSSAKAVTPGVGALGSHSAGTDVARAGDTRGHLELRSVSFRYQGSRRNALTDVDLDVAPGEHVALVGETGAGKSTLLKLVARFHDPTHGSVSLDGTNLRDLDLHAVRSKLGYVPQEPFLFTASIADNIAFGRPHATRAEITAAALAVGAHEIIEALPGGYDHVVGKRGRSLSAGELQLVCLARALIVDPAILLLDEATANLDPRAENRVQAGLDAVTFERTTLVIAHRLSTARSMDRIVVVSAGRIVEDGTHEDLAEAGGWYQRSWEATLAAQGPAGAGRART